MERYVFAQYHTIILIFWMEFNNTQAQAGFIPLIHVISKSVLSYMLNTVHTQLP